MNPIQDKLMEAISKIMMKDKVFRASAGADLAGFGAGIGNAALNEGDNNAALSGALFGGGIGAGAGTRIGVGRDIVDNIVRESNLRQTGMKSAVPKFVRDPKRMALYAALGLVGGGALGGGIGSLFD